MITFKQAPGECVANPLPLCPQAPPDLVTTSFFNVSANRKGDGHLLALRGNMRLLQKRTVNLVVFFCSYSSTKHCDSSLAGMLA